MSSNRSAARRRTFRPASAMNQTLRRPRATDGIAGRAGEARILADAAAATR